MNFRAMAPRSTPSWQSAEERRDPRPTEEERTRSWVEERFRELGFNTMQAASLADTGADWHEARALLEKGCPLAQVIDLLLL